MPTYPSRKKHGQGKTVTAGSARRLCYHPLAKGKKNRTASRFVQLAVKLPDLERCPRRASAANCRARWKLVWPQAGRPTDFRIKGQMFASAKP